MLPCTLSYYGEYPSNLLISSCKTKLNSASTARHLRCITGRYYLDLHFTEKYSWHMTLKNYHTNSKETIILHMP